MYGTLSDFDQMQRDAQERGIRIILDFVVNHTSDQHKWFIDSRSSRTSKHRDWYIWRDGKAPNQPPNNWTFDVWRIGVAVRRQDQPVLLPLLLSAAARPELAQSRGQGRDVRRDALVVRPRRRRLPSGRGRHALRRSQPARQSRAARQERLRRSQHEERVQRQAARGARRPAGAAQGCRRIQRGADRRDLDRRTSRSSTSITARTTTNCRCRWTSCSPRSTSCRRRNFASRLRRSNSASGWPVYVHRQSRHRALLQPLRRRQAQRRDRQGDGGTVSHVAWDADHVLRRRDRHAEQRSQVARRT